MKQDNSSKNGVIFIYNYVKKYWLAMIFVMLFVLLAAYLQVETPKLMGTALKDMGTYLSALLTNDPNASALNDTFNQGIIKLVIGFLLLALSMFMYTFLMADVGAKTSSSIRISLFKKLQRLAIKFFDESNDGDILSRFTNDVDNISNLFNQAFVQILSSGVLVIAIGYSMFKENFIIALIIVALAVVSVILITLITRVARGYVNQQQVTLGLLNGYIDEKISGQKVIITTGREQETYNNFLPFNEAYRKVSQKGQALSNLLFPIVNGIQLLTLAIVIYMSADLIKDGNMDIGLLFTFTLYIPRFFQPITQIVSQYSVVRLGLSGASRVNEIIDEVEDVVDYEGAKVIDGIKKDVVLKDVSFSYDGVNNVLNDINITVPKGKKIALVGPTGSGKTTIMNLLNRFYDVNEGAILIDGVNVKDIKLQSLRTNVGIVLQDSVLFKGSIRDNIIYGKKNASDEEMINAAKLANIHDYIMSLDNKYDTLIDNANSGFSVGQKQLMSIARTIITNPDLLILDEATSNVDTVTEAKIQAAMNNVLENRTSFVIAHRLKTILDSDLIVVLKEGMIIEQGSHQELLDLDGFYAELYYNQFVLED